MAGVNSAAVSLEEKSAVPIYPVATLLNRSSAVTVKESATPAVIGLVLTATAKSAAGPGTKVTEGRSPRMTAAVPGFAVAVKVFGSAFVELIFVTNTPVSRSVGPVAEVLNVLSVPVDTTETGRAPIG